ncbi:MAG: ABC transporter permease subunit [Roseburia sp.]|nr:ABC transporter permease subunit [Roseburia sp.]MCM1098477.1 ABC transporter permease subunit [Ruminococcus flavefaciens]
MAKGRDVFKPRKLSWKQDFKRNGTVYLMFLPAFVMTVVLHYFPMFGIVMAFEDYEVRKGFFGSKWVGMTNFVILFTGGDFPIALRNTVCIAVIKATIGFVFPILFAFLLSMLKSKRYKRTVQTCSYLPNFVAAVVVCALFTEFLSKDGPLTMLLTKFGAENQNWFANDKIPVFWIIYVLMGVWQGIGWGSIMYVAAIATVNGDLHEAAAIDGASRLQRMVKITLPCIMPTIVMMFVLNIGLSFSTGYDNILLLYMPSTYNVADTVYTYTYRLAFGGGGNNYSLSAASGLFQSVVSTVLLVGSNALSKKVGDGNSLF